MSKKNGEPIIINPEYETLASTQVENKYERAEAISERSGQKGKNVARYFDTIYDAVRTNPVWRGERLHVEDPSSYGMSDVPFTHSPDSLKLYESGPVYGEVKTTGFQNAKFWCSPKQFLRHWQLVEKRLDGGDKLPVLDYGFFRYGFLIPGTTRYDQKLHECNQSGKKVDGEKHNCDNRCLTTNLINKTVDLTILPINVLLAAFMSNKFAKRGTMDQTTSQGANNVQDYFWPKGKLSTQLQKTGKRKVTSMEELFGDSISSEAYDVLSLRNLNIVREDSPDNLFCLLKGITGFPYKVKQFPIVRVERDESVEREWVERFQYHGRDILKFSLGITDLEEALHEEDF